MKEISAADRRAIWEGYRRKCFYCNRPILFSELEIDHIIPKSLINNKIKFKNILEQLNLKQDYDINNFQNLVPCHKRCNNRKRNSLFPKKTLLYYFELTKKKTNQIVKLREIFNKLTKKEEVFSLVQIAIEKGEIKIEEIIDVLKKQKIIIDTSPIVVCFGLNIFNLEEKGYLKGKKKYLSYAALCDLFESELLSNIRKLNFYNFFISEPSLRNGECLSLRIAFYDLKQEDLNNIYNNIESYWEILEISSYYDLYEKPAKELYFSGMTS